MFTHSLKSQLLGRVSRLAIALPWALIAFATVFAAAPRDAAAQSQLEVCLRYTRYSVYVRESSGALTHSGGACGQAESFTIISKNGGTIVDGSQVYIRGRQSNKWWGLRYAPSSGIQYRIDPFSSSGSRATFVVDRVYPQPWSQGSPISVGVYIKIRASLAYEANAILKTGYGSNLGWDVDFENEEAATFEVEAAPAPPAPSCQVVSPTVSLGNQNGGIRNLPVCTGFEGGRCNPIFGTAACRRGNYEPRVCDCECASDGIYRYECM